MAYDPQFKHYDSTGTLYTGVYASGIITDWSALDAYMLTSRGLGGGKLTLAGHYRNARKLQRGEIVRFFYDSTDSDPYWLGIIDSDGRTIEGDKHQYELRSPWSWIEEINVTAAQTFTNKSPEFIIDWLLDNYITATQITAPVSLPASGVTIGVFDVLAGYGQVARAIEQLALLASETTRWCYGVKGDLEFYFQPVDYATVALSYEVGVDASQGREELRRRDVSNRVDVVGGFIPDANYQLRTAHISAPSIAAWGPSPRRRMIQLPGIRTAAASTQAATGFFTRYANPSSQFDALKRAHELDESPPIPWGGVLAVYDAPQAGAGVPLALEPIAELQFEATNVFEYSARIGLEDSEVDPYAPNEDRDIAQTSLAPFPQIIDSMIPPATESTPPAVEYPGGPGNSGGGGGGGDLAEGTFLELSAPHGCVPGDFVGGTVCIANGGGALDSGSVAMFVKQFNSSHTQIASVSITMEVVQTEGDIETWKIPDANWIEVEATAAYMLWCARYDAGGGNFSFFPAELDEDPEACVFVRVIDITGGGIFAANTIVVGWTAPSS